MSDPHWGYVRIPDSIPDIMTAAQFAAMNRAADLQPERRLLAAMLLDAIAVVRGHRGAGLRRDGQKTAIAEAREWLASDGSDSLFSFRGACAELDLDPVTLRKQIVAKGHGALRLPGSSGIGRILVSATA